MMKYILTFTLLSIFAITEIASCGCGCGRPADFGQFPDYDYDSLGVQTYDRALSLSAPLEIQKPLYPPPPSLCKELGIPPLHPAFPPPPLCSDGIWKPLLPKCLQKRIRRPFCLSGANLLRQKLALSKMQLGGCGCGYGLF